MPFILFRFIPILFLTRKTTFAVFAFSYARIIKQASQIFLAIPFRTFQPLSDFSYFNIRCIIN
ncbi:hypothetical protein H640_05053 [Cutibacterium granulosum TM11]|uniref:Uncharacterized protein n=1 Tax=Cutibacterium granulosum TM11 TaxID=1292373 RepID=A0ACB4UNM9_9ACTN|nr:hypothetical protein H640_05053 [Cutibacterium granulosum TM11]